MTTLREAAQQALEALERAVPTGAITISDFHAAITALRAALAEQKCPCGDRPADQCPGEWEPGCDLGANEKHVKVVKVAEQAQPVQPTYWGVFEGGNLHDFFTVRETAEEMAYYKGSHAVVGPIYTTPPGQQSLRDLCAAAYQVVGVADGPVEMLDNLWAAAEGKPLPHDPGAGLPWSPPSPQPLTDKEILSVVGWERAETYMKLAPNFPVDEARQETLKNYRAVEAEVIRRMGVQR